MIFIMPWSIIWLVEGLRRRTFNIFSFCIKILLIYFLVLICHFHILITKILVFLIIQLSLAQYLNIWAQISILSGLSQFLVLSYQLLILDKQNSSRISSWRLHQIFSSPIWLFELNFIPRFNLRNTVSCYGHSNLGQLFLNKAFLSVKIPRTFFFSLLLERGYCHL